MRVYIESTENMLSRLRLEWIAIATSVLLACNAMAGEMAGGDRPASLVPMDAIWSLLPLNGGNVVYSGVIDSDLKGAGSGQILYPAPNVAGLIAAIITHGVIVDSIKSSEKERRQETANRVLQPYQEVIGNYKHAELIQRGLEKTSSEIRRSSISSPAESVGDWLIESKPAFLITQDQRAIVLENQVALYKPGTTTSPVLQYTLRVVSSAKDLEDPVSFWTANQGERIKDVSAELFARSLDIALRDAAGGYGEHSGTHKTIRYREGSNEKIERVLILNEDCNRLVVKNLRGWLMSVPVEAKSATTPSSNSCVNHSKT